MSQPPTGSGDQPPYPPPAGPGQPVPQQYGPTGQPADQTRQFAPGQYGTPQPPAEPTQQFGQYGNPPPPAEPTQQFGQYGAPQPGQYGAPQPAPPAPAYGAPQSAPPAPAYGAPQSAPPAPAYGAPQSAPPAPAYGAPQSAPPAPAYGAPQSAPPAPAYGQQPPQSAPPFGPPVSTPPVSAPGYAQPMSVPPASGPGFGQPMSGPPGAPPYGPAAPAAGKGRRSVLVLALVAGLLFVLGGVMTGLYVTKGNELDRTEKRLTAQVSERDGTITANKTEIEKLKKDLQGVRDKLSTTEQDLTGTRNDRDEQARQKKVIATCLDKLTSALAAAAANNKAAYDKATQGMNKVCDEAEDYL
ncbi:hypothetical protein C5N14_07215 [Micromonospora sp. MW-13]|uniref:hypothetical protein n=1 Tax=Micromonospora sp. MW-13 TaxID=2094022 RepID=UPI000EE962F8|nr:hypothetical protein [Micromonospora sp. MW-13]RGC70202.1 hypothetical protein C5N14_07215 [Micromonospora sp. MW-13]